PLMPVRYGGGRAIALVLLAFFDEALLAAPVRGLLSVPTAAMPLLRRRPHRVSALRIRQAAVGAPPRGLIVGAEQAALLQFRDHHVHEVVVLARNVGRHDAEAVAGAGLEPGLHVVGDLPG